MTHDPRSDVARIVRHLADLPGSSAVSILSRRFTRYSPAEHEAYQEAAGSYPIADLPDQLTVLPDSDEIVITLRGHLPEPARTDDLVDQLNLLLDDDDLAESWQSRAELPILGRDYALTLFTV